MRVIEARNVCEAYWRGRQLLDEIGEVQPSRAGDVTVATCPVTTVYHRPQERVLFATDGRVPNPVFHLMESLWMLDGRWDAEWLDQFVRDYSRRFGDTNHGAGPGEPAAVQWGAYGKRWRDWFDMNLDVPYPPHVEKQYGDQLLVAIRALRENPQDRRVVVQMWDASQDMGRSLRDVPCLAGETVVWSPEGDLTIRELSDMFSSGKIVRWPVFSVDETTKEVSIEWCSRVWCSGRKKVLRITFDDGSVLRVTSDHTVYVREARAVGAIPVQASSLVPGSRVLATKMFSSAKGHRTFKRRLGENTNYGNMVMVHREYASLLWGDIPPKHDVHHKSENKLDNRADNLEILSVREHSRLHRLGDKNPMRNMTPEQHAARGRKHSESVRKTWADRKDDIMSKRRATSEARASSVDNHIVVSVELEEETEVFDFTTDKKHTAIVGTGVVVHNCNLTLVPRIVGGRLDISVFCRSNDLVWGAYGANAVHFSVLQEYLAAGIGVPMGRYHQVSVNFHMYESVLSQVGPTPAAALDYYASGEVEASPIVAHHESFDEEMHRLLDRGPDEAPRGYPRNPFLWHTAAPMWRVNRWRLDRHWSRAEEEASHIASPDWRLGTLTWLHHLRERTS